MILGTRYLVLSTWSVPRSVRGPLVLRPSGTWRRKSDSIVKRTKDLGPGTDQALSTKYQVLVTRARAAPRGSRRVDLPRRWSTSRPPEARARSTNQRRRP